MEIRFLNTQDVVVYRELRLQALKDSPTAFGSSYEEESCFSLPDFAARLRPHNDPANSIFGAFGNTDKLIGMLGFSRENRLKRFHIGSLWSMYVLPENRGQGVGAALLDRVLSHARCLSGLRQISLTVTTNNLPACSLYQSRGFERFGKEHNALFINGTYFDEEHLVLYFNHDV
ncbi:GNAT family N-acetyltransferase [Nostoc punctiforme]|uniref:GCN5-related N-acetyltransferase n=1 Tax=Nostoc punctiforme (strain ATCC 29133 / PCC 73102) TaxID=63737 RepID=B2JBD6_NOSP7|nr:GNAT family N-acetyltransferase [Nostoc punctiforme]ACC85240.1 GCN5-related N-acetyltransferase [Nostoc punctiforme PCC 73102]